MAKDNNLQDFLVDIANAIREKTTARGLINPQDFSTRIRKMESFEYLDISNDPLLYSDLIAYSTYIRYTDDLDIIIDLRNNIDNISEIIPNIKFIAINFNALIKKLILGEIVKITIKDVILEHLTQTLLDDIPRISRSTFYVMETPNTYTYIEAIEDDLTVSFTNPLQYSLDLETWEDLNSNSLTPPINTGEKIYFKANITPVDYKGIGTFNISKKCNVGGNTMSLLYGDDYKDKTDITGFTFYRLFLNLLNIILAHKLLLPADTLKTYCYSLMFSGCTSLTTAPELPATIMASRCYNAMFNDCKSLTEAPNLPSTELAANCYEGMFVDCTSLTTAPELPATTLAEYCYFSMFENCKSLTTAPILPATILTSNCYYLMFWGCSKINKVIMLATDISATDCLKNWVKYVPSTGTFIKNKDMESLPLSSVNGIPYGWVVEDYISELDT